jgi:hypothetical protein
MKKSVDGLIVKPFKSTKQGIKQPKACENDILPRLHCSYLFVGRSGSGKTNTLLHLLKSKDLLKGAFQTILYLSDSVDDTVKDNMKDEIPSENFIKEFDEAFINKILSAQEAEIKKKGYTKARNVALILDDILSKKKFLNSKIMMKLCTCCRHYNTSIFILSQSYKNIPRALRLQMRGIVFLPSSLNEVNKFAEEQCLPNMGNKRFKELIQYATKEPYQFCFINNDSQQKLRKGFNKLIM